MIKKILYLLSVLIQFLYAGASTGVHFSITESSGTSTADDLNSSQNGSLFGGIGQPSFVSSSPYGGTYLNFTSSSAQFVLVSNSEVRFTTGFVFMGYIRTSQSSGTIGIMGKGKSGEVADYGVSLTDGKPQVSIVDNTDQVHTFTANVSVADGNWFHLGASYDQTSGLKILVDGTEYTETIPTTNKTISDHSDYNLVFGGGDAALSITYFNGDMDDLWVADNFDTPLPVEMLTQSANAVLYDSSVYVALSWTTASEIRNLGFLIERSLSPNNELKQIPHGWIDGRNGTKQNHYQIIDKSVEEGNSYYYRLVDIDFSGKKTIHPQMKVNVPRLESTRSKIIPSEFSITAPYPNPFNGITRFSIVSNQENGWHGQVLIYNLKGELVQKLFNGLVSTNTKHLSWNNKLLNGNNAPSGTYLIKAWQGSTFKQIKITYLK